MPGPAKLLMLALLSLFVTAWGARAQDAPTAISEAHDLPTGTNVRLQGIVTFVTDNDFCIQQDGVGIKARYVNAAAEMAPGDEILASGTLTRQWVELTLRCSGVKNLGHKGLPEPAVMTLEQTGAENIRYKRVRTMGSVHDVATMGGEILLQIWNYETVVMVHWHPTSKDEVQSRPDELLDAVVEVTGVTMKYDVPNSRWPRNQIVLQSSDDIRVVKKGSPNVLDRPLTKISAWKQKPSQLAERTRLIGTVTHSPQSGYFYMQDDSGTAIVMRPAFLSVVTSQRRATLPNPPVSPGDVVEVIGYAGRVDATANMMTVVSQAEWRILRHDGALPFEPMKLATILQGGYDGRSVSVTGRVLGVTVQKQMPGAFVQTITLDDSGAGCYAMLLQREQTSVRVKAGDYVRVNGVVAVMQQAKDGTQPFRLALNDADAITKIPAPLAADAILRWVLAGVVVLLAAIIWIVLLRRQVRTRTKELLQANAQLARFKQVAEISTELVAMATLDRRPIYFNPAGRRMLGYSADERVEDIDFSEIYTKETLERFEREGFAQAFERGHWEAEVTMLHRDGREIPVAFTGLVLRDAEGKPECMSCIARDISQRIAIDKQLRDSLAHERELNALKSGFVNTISHEFRTPLGIILFASSMLRRFNERFGPAERTEQLNDIDEAVERMNDLVEQSLSLGRAEVAKPKITTFDPLILCHRVADEVQSATAHRSPIEIATEKTPEVQCDETMLRTILANLLHNAVKYAPAASPVELSFARMNGNAVFTIRDHGLGLEEEDLPKLFTAFYRGQNTRGVPGTGLGLAIVKRCTEALGGKVSARNAEGGGAEFTVTLPIFPDQESPASTHTQSP